MATIEIHADYRHYNPPEWVDRTVRRLLDSVLAPVNDEIVADLSQRPLANWQFFRDRAVGRVLFHEIGHHLDCTIGAEARSGEPAADAWARTFWRRHARRHYWYLRPFKPLFALLARVLKSLAARA